MIDKIVYCMKKGGKCILNVGNKQYTISDDIKSYLKEKYDIRTRNADFSLDSDGAGKIRSSEEDFLYFQK